MDCAKYQQQVWEYLDDALSCPALEALRAHLQECRACADDFARHQKVDAAMRRFPAESPPCPTPDLLPGVLAAVAAFEEEEALASLYETSTPHGAARERLLASPAYRREIEELAKVEAALAALAERQTPAPAIDLVDPVMHAIGAFEAAQPALEDEFSIVRDVRQIEAALEEMGAAYTASSPQVDLVDSVMARLPKQEKAAANIAPFRTRPKPPVQVSTPEHGRHTRGLAAAAAACLLAAASWMALNAGQDTANTQVAQDTVEQQTSANGRETVARVDDGANENNLRPVKPFQPIGEPPARPEPATRRGDAAEISLQAALNTHRQALMKDAEAIQTMADWASLTPEEARELLAAEDLTLEALVGAAEFLPPEEAVAVLAAAAAQHPEDPYLRFALAKNYRELGDFDAARTELAAWNKLDPENSLPYFMEANVLFAQGDTQAAMESLSSGASLSTASSYEQAGAHFQEETLLARGLDPDVARYIAATTAGAGNYEDLAALGQELNAYGDYFASVEDYKTAEEVYRAVQQLGMQVDEGTSYNNVHMAGIDLQMTATESLMELYEMLNMPESQQMLVGVYEGLINSLESVSTVVNDYASYVGQLSEAELRALSNQIMEEGDDVIYPSSHLQRLGRPDATHQP